ncbi:MAG: hypothetical protein LBQ40_00600 [Clostridiales bacterium]|jgi:thymidine kinase|nr:hypothetical protein [Clostridiales bacterium]
MIKLIVGSKGSGKTKKIIDLANAVDTLQKHTVFITDTNRYVYDIKHGVRFINSAECGAINDAATLLSFLGGLVACDADIDPIFIDGIARITKKEISELEEFFDRADKITGDAVIVFTISMDETALPEYLAKYEKI